MGATPRPRHALSEAVATLLPTPAETQLLAGCVDRGPGGRRALEAWFARHADPIAELAGGPIKWLMPLVWRACGHHRLDPRGALATVLKTAALREEMRSRSYRAIRGSLLRGLAAAGIRPIVLKGAALGELVYPDASLRHAHDVELLVRDADWPRLDAALAPLGFAGAASPADSPRVELAHVSGLPLVLHRRLFRIPFHNVQPDDVWQRAETATLDGVEACVLSPADALVYGCGEGLHSAGRASYRWIVDAWFLLDRRRDVNWDAVARITDTRQMALPLAVSLSYLADQLDAPVPGETRDRLAAAAARDRSIGPELALHAARAGAGGLARLLARTRTIGGRAAIFRHRLLPSIVFLWWSTQPRSSWLRTIHGRAFRVARYVARRVS